MDRFEYYEDKISAKPAIDLLMEIGYTYLSVEQCNDLRDNHYSVLLKPILKERLREINSYEYGGEVHKFSDASIERAVEALDEPLADNLVLSSEKIYNALMLGKSFPETQTDGCTKEFNIKYIDWDNISNNVFHVTREFPVQSFDCQHNTRPDIVLFVNGIPFGVIECKSSLVSVEQAVEQMIRNQKSEYTPQLFKYTQILMVTNKNFVKYATTGTPKEKWCIWREEEDEWRNNVLKKYVVDRNVSSQDENIVSLFSPERLMDITHFFIVYDTNMKKICRHQQYFAIKNIVKTVSTFDEYGNRNGGVIWHTQGSGKSLTMVMLAKYILHKMREDGTKVILVTDRKELDRQIADTFSHTRLSPAKATTGKHLIDLIQNTKADVVTTLINKFKAAAKQKIKIESRNIFVLVDESHRSNYGALAAMMRNVFTHGCYLGFTGTPLMKKDKSTVGRFGGNGYIHTYTINDGVEDGEIVRILYEGRFVDQKVDEDTIDQWFKETTPLLNERQQEDLKRNWSRFERLASTEPRISRIALDIYKHYSKNFKNIGTKAMLATNFKRDAIRYLEAFKMFPGLKCEVVISKPDDREGEEDIYSETDDKVLKFWKHMMDMYGSEDKYQDTIKDRFCDGEIDILIVCSKLLTGFDAPICQVLYIDKELKEHNLLQAIARTNRLYEGKDYGLVVDYRGLIKNLDDALNMYSGAGLEKFDGSELKGVVVDVMNAVGELKHYYSQVVGLFSSLRNKDDPNEYEDLLGKENLRNSFYESMCEYGKKLSIVLSSEKATDAIGDSLEKIKNDFVFFTKLRKSVKLRYADAIDHKEYELIMQNLLDKNLSVTDLKVITPLIDILDSSAMKKQLKELKTDRAKADSIRSCLNKSISEKYDENPAYYDSFSKRIKEVLERYKKRVINEAEYLSQTEDLLEEFRKGRNRTTFPERIKNDLHSQAFFGVLNSIFEKTTEIKPDPDDIAYISSEITRIIKENRKVDWATNTSIQKIINQNIDDLIYDVGSEKGWIITDDLLNLIETEILKIASRRF